MAFGQRGRMPTIDGLEARIDTLEKQISRGQAAAAELPTVRAKLDNLLQKMSDPEYRETLEAQIRKEQERLQRKLDLLETL